MKWIVILHNFQKPLFFKVFIHSTFMVFHQKDHIMNTYFFEQNFFPACPRNSWAGWLVNSFLRFPRFPLNLRASHILPEINLVVTFQNETQVNGSLYTHVCHFITTLRIHPKLFPKCFPIKLTNKSRLTFSEFPPNTNLQWITTKLIKLSAFAIFVRPNNVTTMNYWFNCLHTCNSWYVNQRRLIISTETYFCCLFILKYLFTLNYTGIQVYVYRTSTTHKNHQDFRQNRGSHYHHFIVTLFVRHNNTL